MLREIATPPKRVRNESEPERQQSMQKREPCNLLAAVRCKLSCELVFDEPLRFTRAML